MEAVVVGGTIDHGGKGFTTGGKRICKEIREKEPGQTKGYECPGYSYTCIFRTVIMP